MRAPLHRRTSHRDAPRGGALVAVLMAATAAYSLSQTLVIPALGTLTSELGTDPATASWLVTAFLVSSAVATPIVGRLGDLYGPRRVLVVVLLLFALGSALSAVAESALLMIAGRVISGVLGGAFPLAYAIIRRVLPAGEVPRRLATLSAVFGIGGAVGLPLSGVIVDYTSSVRLVFWIGVLTVPIAVAVLAFVPRTTSDDDVPPIDWIGSVLFTGGLGATLLAITRAEAWGWGSPAFLACAVAGPAVLVAFVAFERRQPHPLVDIAMLRRRPMLIANAVAMLVGLSTFACFVLLPALASAPTSTGYGLGLSVSAAGLLLVPQAITSIIGSQLAGTLGARWEYRTVLTLGLAIVAASLVGIIAWREHWAPLAAVLAFQGIGIGMAMAAITNVVVAHSATSEVGIATGINALVRNVGSATGAAVSALVLSLSLLPSGLPSDGAYAVTFTGAAVIAVVAVAVSLLLRAAGEGAGRMPRLEV